MTQHKKRKKAETLVASVAAFNEDGHLLFGLRSDNNKWTLPGGHFEVDDDEEMEDPRHAAVRELREETGLKPTSLEYIGHGVVRRTHGNVRVFCFKAKVSGKPSGKDDPDQECATWRWVDVKNGVPHDIEEHLKDRNNVTLRLLGIHEGEVRKYESELADPLGLSDRKSLMKAQDTSVPPPGWKPHRMYDTSEMSAEQLHQAWQALKDYDHHTIWQQYNFSNSRRPEESDADFMARSPDPVQRSMSIKMPSATKKHLMMLVDDPEASRSLVPSISGQQSNAYNRANALIDHPAFDKDVAKYILGHRSPFITGHTSADAKTAVLEQQKVPLEAGDLEDLVQHFTPNVEHAAKYLNPEGAARYSYEPPNDHRPDDGQLVRDLYKHPAISSDQIKRLALYGHDNNPYLSAEETPEVFKNVNRETNADIVDEFMKMNDADLIPPGFRSGFMGRLLAQGSLHPETINKVLDHRNNEPPSVAFRNHNRTPQHGLEAAVGKNEGLTADHLKRILTTQNTHPGDVWWNANEKGVGLRLQALKHKNMSGELLTHAQQDPSAQVRYGLLNRHDLLQPEHLDRATNDDDDLVRIGVAESPRATPEQLQKLQQVNTDKHLEKLKGNLNTSSPLYQQVKHSNDRMSAALISNPNTSDTQWSSIVRNQAGMTPWLMSEAVKAPKKNAERLNTLVNTIAEKAPSGDVGGVLTNIISSEWPEFNQEHAKKLIAALPQRVSSDAKAKLIKKFPWSSQELHQIVHDNNQNPDIRVAALNHLNTGIETARDVLNGRTLPHAGMTLAAFKHPGLTSDELLREAGSRSDSQNLNAIINHPNAGSEHLTRAMTENPHFAADQLRHNHNIKLEHVMTALKDREHSVREAAIGHPLAPQEEVQKAVFNPKEHINVRTVALNTGRLQVEDLQKLIAAGQVPAANAHGAPQPSIDDRVLATRAQDLLSKESPDTVFKEKVGVKLGLGKLRKIRDLIAAKTGRMFMHQKDLPPGDWAPGRGPDGNIHASKLQEHIDKQPALNFNVSHDKWEGAQRHSKTPSNVFQLNITSDQIRKMKDAGVYSTFRKMQEASSYSSHPVAKYHGIGWVRYTGTPKSGYFVDEVQSDFGQSFVRQAAAQAAAGGQDTEEAAKRAERDYPEDHFKKISSILFNNKHPNEVLHEAFQQHLRDKGQVGARIQTHTVESKAPISLGRELPRKCKHCNEPESRHYSAQHECAVCGETRPLHHSGTNHEFTAAADAPNHTYEAGEVDRTKAPGHFNVTYNDVPKKMGFEPSTYGKLRTQTNKDMKGAPTWETKLAKFEDQLNLWLAQQKLTKAIDPEHLKPVARYHDGALGEVFVDHHKEENAHPDEQSPHVEAFKHVVLKSPDVVKRGKTGTKESSNSTGKVVYDVKDHQIGDDLDHRFMVKPYHEKVVPRARSWMHFPIQGWAEMTNQALYHSAQIGHLHQRVHVTEVPLPGASAPARRTPKALQEQRTAMWQQVLKDIPSIRSKLDNPKHAQTNVIWRGVLNEMGIPSGGGTEAWAKHHDVYHERLKAAGYDPLIDTEPMPNPEYTPEKSKAVDEAQSAEWNKRMKAAGIHWEEHEGAAKPPPGPSKMAPALVIHMQPDVGGVRYMTPKNFSPEEKAQGRQIGLMDFLTNNLDRHETNLLYDHANAKMLAIDHSRSFQYKTRDKGIPATQAKDDALGNYLRGTAIGKVIGTKTYGDKDALNQWNEDWGNTFEWWKQNAPAIKKTMTERLQMVKDRAVRAHIQRNFDARAHLLDDMAQNGHENFGQQSWENTSVPIFQYK